MTCNIMLQKLTQLFVITLITCMVLVKVEETNEDNIEEDLFKQLFKRRRSEQLEAIKKISNLQEDKQQKMVVTVTKTVFDVILKSRVILENSGFIPGVSKFPDHEHVRDALSLVLENTALLGDLVLRLPDVAGRELRSVPEWPALFSWSLGFATQSRLLDPTTIKLISLVEQELNLTERSPDYINPYRKTKEKIKFKSGEDNIQLKKTKKRKDIPRGPRLTLPQEGEL